MEIQWMDGKRRLYKMPHPLYKLIQKYEMENMNCVNEL